ncbi:MAG TPA: hypothetical protein PKC30_07160 [Saprospiraceae bacterium]|nr:hypothetical protein [Saprospiraceae bacterium]
MKRREAIYWLAAGMGGSLVASHILGLSCTTPTPQSISEFESFKKIINSIGHFLLPPTEKHPGFLAVNDTDVALAILGNCYRIEDKEKVKEGLTKLDSQWKDLIKDNQVNIEALWISLLSPLDEKCFSDLQDSEKEDVLYFKIVKEVILLVYFTNEEVMTKTFTYVKVPGKYEGNRKIQPNEYMVRFGLGD